MLRDIQILTEKILHEYAVFIGIDNVKFANIVGLFLLFIGLQTVMMISWRISRSCIVNVEVVDLIKEKGDDGSVFNPLFRIIDGPFRSIECQSSLSSSWHVYKVGETITGFYNKNSNTIDSIKTVLGLYILGLFLLYFGYSSMFR